MFKSSIFLACVVSASAAEINGVADLAKITTPSSAPTNFARLYMDSLTATQKCINADGTNSSGQ